MAYHNAGHKRSNRDSHQSSTQQPLPPLSAHGHSKPHSTVSHSRSHAGSHSSYARDSHAEKKRAIEQQRWHDERLADAQRQTQASAQQHLVKTQSQHPEKKVSSSLSSSSIARVRVSTGEEAKSTTPTSLVHRHEESKEQENEWDDDTSDDDDDDDDDDENEEEELFPVKRTFTDDNQVVASALNIPHSWAQIVQSSAQHAHSQSQPQAQPHNTTSSSVMMMSSSHHSATHRSKRGRHSGGHSSNYSPQTQRFYNAIQANRVDKEQQKHVDRAARHSHDQLHCRDAIISVLACVLEQLFPLRASDTLPDNPALITLFHTERVPSISISAYLLRLAQYTECSSEVLIQALIHINRIVHHRPSFKINSLNIHRLWLTSLLCSAKFFDDMYYNNAYFAKVGGIPNKELNDLEIEFLALINFDLFVDFNVYQHFYDELKTRKLHTHCQCQYRVMPEIETTFYRRPAEYEHLANQCLTDLCADDDSVSVSEGELKGDDNGSECAVTHCYPSTLNGSASGAFSPATTDSSLLSHSSSSTSSDDVSEDESESGIATNSHATILTEPSSLIKEISASSTLSVAQRLDSLAVNSISEVSETELGVEMSDSPTLVANNNDDDARRFNGQSVSAAVTYGHAPQAVMFGHQFLQHHPHSLPIDYHLHSQSMHPYCFPFAPPPPSHPYNLPYAAPPLLGVTQHHHRGLGHGSYANATNNNHNHSHPHQHQPLPLHHTPIVQSVM